MTTNTITIRFFARLREELETESLDLPARPGLTAGDLIEELAGRGGPWATLQGSQPVMIAVNQAMAKPATQVNGGDEVAFFPPVTGG
jgi:molybdopterin synthase sulfur carrier subunit